MCRNIAMTGGSPVTPSSATQVVPSGLAAYWRLDETSGTTAYDSSGNDHNGTMIGGMNAASQSTTGIVKNALQFTGAANNYGINIPHNAALTPASWTVTAWFMIDERDGQGAQTIINKVQGAGWVDYRLDINQPENHLRCYYQRSGSSVVAQSADDLIVPGQWYHAACAHDPVADTLQLYLNGEPVSAPVTATLALPNTSANINIGYRGDTADDYINGKIDEIRLYNRVLTADEVQQIYNARDGIRYNADERVMEYFDGNKFVSMTPPWPDVTGDLVAHWKLDETGGAMAEDSSGNGNHGVFQNGLLPAQNSILGAVGRAIDFTPDSVMRIEVPYNPSLTPASGDLSIAFWVNSSDDWNNLLPDTWRLMDTKAAGATFSPGWSLFVNGYIGSMLGIYMGDGTNDAFFGSGGLSWESNRWYHVAFTYDGDAGTGSWYRDGVFLNADTYATFTPDWGTDNLRIGTGYYNASLNGALDDIRLYGRVLSPADIQKLYRMGSNPIGQNTALPQGCPNIGDACDDGTIYAGLSPDGDVEMFIVPTDTPPGISWNAPGYNNYRSTGATNDNTGAANTALILRTDADTAAGFQIHAAAHYCAKMQLKGASDFYLPAIAELSALYDEREAIGGLGTYTYWSSTETSTNTAQTLSFNDDGTVNVWATKNGGFRVICIRKGPAPRCANPNGIEGQMMYNQDYSVVQYCDGARWIARLPLARRRRNLFEAVKLQSCKAIKRLRVQSGACRIQHLNICRR